MDSATACSLLLVGQPTLARQLRMGIFAALDQRITTRYQIAPMDLGESPEYLRHQLVLVGRTDPLFADDAIAHLHKARGCRGCQQRCHGGADCCHHRRQGTGG